MSGQVISTAIIVDETGQEEQIKVPLGAILTEGEAQYVWIVDSETMTVSRREIEIGPNIGSELVVESGLIVGDTIVGAGASYLHEGMQIRAYEN